MWTNFKKQGNLFYENSYSWLKKVSIVTMNTNTPLINR